MTTRVLVVDDCRAFRHLLAKALNEDPSLEVVGVAEDAYAARDAIVRMAPQVMTLDVHMPRMSGLDFLEKLMPQYPIPVIVLTSVSDENPRSMLRAFELGAIDFVAKPSTLGGHSMENMLISLRTKIKIAAKADVSHWKEKWSWRQLARLDPVAMAGSEKKVIAIGASTGGTEAVRRIVCALPRATPGVVVVQHMPPGFTQMFAQRLNQQSQMLVREAKDGDKVRPGEVLIAPGGYQLRLKSLPGGRMMVSLQQEGLVSGHEPSVDVLMSSCAAIAGPRAVGVILTGMGSDGAQGLLRLRQAGGATLAQDEASCVIFGMPKEAYRVGAVESLVPLSGMAEAIILRAQALSTARAV